MLKIYHSSFKSEFKMAAGTIEDSELVARDVETGDEILRWPLYQLTAKPAGSSRDLYQIECVEHPDYTIFTRDPAVLERLPQIKKKAGLDFSRLAPWIFVTAVIAGLFFVYFVWTSQKDKWTEWIVESLPIEWEVQLGEVLANQMIGFKSRPYIQQSKDLVELLKPLLEEAERRFQHPIAIYIIDDPSPNAFALPGGHVAFHSGLLKKAQSLEMIYGVAAHEFAHVIERHSLRSVVGGLSIFVLAHFLFGDWTGFIAILADNTQLLLRQMYSREAEAEADEVGVELLASVQLSARGLYQFFELLQTQQSSAEKEAHESLSFLSTHPPTRERMELMRARIDSKINWLDNDQQKQQQWKDLQNNLQL